MSSREPTSRPPQLFLAALVLAAEAFAAIVFALVEVVQINAARALVGAGVALLMLGLGVFLAAVARGVRSSRRWSRGPAVATQLLQLMIGFSFGGGSTWWVGMLLGGSAVVVLGCLLTPAATAAFTSPGASQD
ncbi:MAG TPA: hypothetical protein VF635_16820 [Propionibacteriaceae bacterium]